MVLCKNNIGGIAAVSAGKTSIKNKVERRNFLKYLGAVAFGSAFNNLLTIKKKNVEHLIPYVVPPDGVVPGIDNWYASICRQCPSGCGIDVKVREGKAKKIEGNPKFPINKGKICARGQAGLQVLYNPDRIKNPLIKENGKFRKASWQEAINFVSTKLKLIKETDSNKAVYVGCSQRGSLSNLVTSFMNNFGSQNTYFYEYFDDKPLIAANKTCFDFEGIPDYDIANAKFIVSLGSNFLENGSSPVKNSVEYGQMRDIATGHKKERGWLAQFEPRLTLTGANADEWHPIKPNTEGLIGLAMAHTIINEKLYDKAIESELDGWKKALDPYKPSKISKQAGVGAKVINKVARQFAQSQPGIALCSDSATAQKNGYLNAIAANVLNHLVGSIDKEGGVRFPVQSFLNAVKQTASFEDMSKLAEKMNNSEVQIAFIHNTNPVYNLPTSVNFKKSLEKVEFKVSFSTFIDETSDLADVILPDSSYLENWDDYIPLTDSGNGTVGLSQPVVSELYKTRSLGDALLLIAKAVGGNVAASLNWISYLDYLKNSWRSIYDNAKKSGQKVNASFDGFWKKSIQLGGFWNDEEIHVKSAKKPTPDILPSFDSEGEEKEDQFHLAPYPGHGVYDGRGANLPWLQQLPEPLVTGAWITWAEINPETAKELKVEEGDLVEIGFSKSSVKLPVYIFQAIEPRTIAIPFGRGHTKYGRYAKSGENIFHNLEALKDETSGSLAWASNKVTVKKTSGKIDFIKTEPREVFPSKKGGMREFDREIVQWISPQRYEEEKHEEQESLEALPPWRKDEKRGEGYRWGMVIDLDKCTGCQACMVACYAENNLQIVPADQLIYRRHKNWIRVDRYWEGEYPNIRAKILPANCYQCGKASCESVCPVYAAYSTKDTLNGQVYQRCVGTRYCNVGCPYKVRLFNWSQPKWPEPLTHQLNTDISVRAAGITEKCTFCVQRIRKAKDTAKDEDRRVRDGEIQPACVQTCPSGAMYFGDLLDKNSVISKLTKNPRRYRVLEEIDTEPGVAYLKAVRKGALPEKEHKEEGEHG